MRDVLSIEMLSTETPFLATCCCIATPPRRRCGRGGYAVTITTCHPGVTYFPSLRKTRLFLVSAVSAFETDFSADLFPFRPIR